MYLGSLFFPFWWLPDNHFHSQKICWQAIQHLGILFSDRTVRNETVKAACACVLIQESIFIEVQILKQNLNSSDGSCHATRYSGRYIVENKAFGKKILAVSDLKGLCQWESALWASDHWPENAALNNNLLTSTLDPACLPMLSLSQLMDARPYDLLWPD